MNRFSPLSLAIAASLALPAVASELPRQPDVVVTASRIEQTIDSTLADISVIDRNVIDASAARDVSDLLRLEAGVDIARTGGAGSQTTVFLRGTNNNHVLVLIDGVRVASLNTGAYAFEQLPLDLIERIEIVRGPRASFWGSDAIGG
ncbi:MAG: TonB-dependent receptor plug domain-containing protein, partial [Dokdonella sp.]